MKENDIPKRPVDLLYDGRREAIGAARCIPAPIGCGGSVSVQGFRDEISKKEFRISGLCQKCQDSVFGA